MNRKMEAKKEKFIQQLRDTRGIIKSACDATGIHRSTYYRWYDNDEAFKDAVDIVKEEQIDFVEEKLLKLIEKGNVLATIFYLKTKGKEHGYWTSRHDLEDENGSEGPVKSIQESSSVQGEIIRISGIPVTRRVKNKKDYIVKLLKKQGKYTAELSMQVNITAQLLVRTEILAEEILSENHQAVNVEISREGNERKTISPKERLYLDFVRQCQKALRALGMNTDSKERRSDNDSFGDFIKEFRDD